jgi:hypothetical protein
VLVLFQQLLLPEERLAELSGITIRCVAVGLQEHE